MCAVAPVATVETTAGWRCRGRPDASEDPPAARRRRLGHAIRGEARSGGPGPGARATARRAAEERVPGVHLQARPGRRYPGRHRRRAATARSRPASTPGPARIPARPRSCSFMAAASSTAASTSATTSSAASPTAPAGWSSGCPTGSRPSTRSPRPARLRRRLAVDARHPPGRTGSAPHRGRRRERRREPDRGAVPVRPGQRRPRDRASVGLLPVHRHLADRRPTGTAASCREWTARPAS